MARQSNTDQIIVVDKRGMTHIQPARNRSNVERQNKYLIPEDRSKIYPYDETKPLSHYIELARGGNNNASQDFAVTRLAEKTQLQAREIADQKKTIEDLKKQLAAGAAAKTTKDKGTN